MTLLRVPALCPAEYAYAATVDPPARLVLTAGACPLAVRDATR